MMVIRMVKMMIVIHWHSFLHTYSKFAIYVLCFVYCIITLQCIYDYNDFTVMKLQLKEVKLLSNVQQLGF